MSLLFEHEVRERLRPFPHLDPIFNDVHDIGRRLREEVDDTLFLVRNLEDHRFEVHSLEHRPHTYAWSVPWRNLDARVVRKAQKNDLGRRGRAIFDEMWEKNRRVEERKKRQRTDDIKAIAYETRSLFKPLRYEIPNEDRRANK